MEVELGAGLTVVVGPNGAGKTTILEALTLVLEGTPLRAGAVRDLIKAGQDHLRIEVDLERAGTITRAAAAYARHGERRLTADGAPLDDCVRWQEALPVRTFVPDDLRLIKGSPRRRREYLDGLAARCYPEYKSVLERYEEALGQRNALLRSWKEQLGSGHFAPWETILAQTGLAVSHWRASTLAAFIGVFQRIHEQLTGDPADSLRLVYRTNVVDLDESDYRIRLAENREADRARTYTNLGPHRDDVRLTRSGIDVRECASQGEQRAALLTLILAEWQHQCATGKHPLLLLDDVMSELDAVRRRALVALVRQGRQVLITTTDLGYFTAEELAHATVIELEAQ